jgi:hypothetical protein
LVGAATYGVRVVLGLADDPSTLGLGLLGEAPFVDEEGCLLLGPGDDPLRLLLGLLDDALTLGIDPFCGADLLGDGDAQLVDQAKGRCLVDDDVARQGQLSAVRDDRFKALDKEDDVDRSALRGGRLGSAGRWPGLSHGATLAERGGGCGPRGPSWACFPAHEVPEPDAH